MMPLYEQSPGSQELSRTLGSVTELMLQDAQYRHFPMACLIAWIQPPLLLRQIKVFYGERGTPSGYITWAYLAADVEERWINDPGVTLHFSEWNEGEALWIMDFVAPSGLGLAMYRFAREELFPDFDVAKSLRRSKDGRVRRVSTWRR